MPRDVILSIDQGTTNTKALLVDRSGSPIFRTTSPVQLLQPQPGFVEQDPAELWQSVLEVIDTCISCARAQDLRIEGIAISNQRETAVAWRPGPAPQAVSNAISWQCRRSSAICDSLTSHAARIAEISGLPLDPLATAGKWAWLLENQPSRRADLLRGDLLLGNVDAWLLSNFTAGVNHATDHSNASRTGLYSLGDLEWSDELLGFYDLPHAGLPRVQPSSSHFGLCATIPELNGVPIVAMIGDSHAALVGHGSFSPGAAKATYGTGSSVMMLTPGLVDDSRSLARTIAWSDAEGVRFALEGNVAMAGSAIQWVGEFLGLQRPIEDAVALAETVANAAGVCFVPAMVGLGAPHWDFHARGLIANLERTHKAPHLAHAALDAIAFQVADVLFCMERTSGVAIASLRVDGGVTRNDRLMQLQSDVFDRPILRSAAEELSALGAARLGGLTLGWWPSAAAMEHLAQPATSFYPGNEKQASQALYRNWQSAVYRARVTPPESLS